MIDEGPMKYGNDFIQHKCFHEFPNDSRAGRDNWTCEIEAGDVARHVEKNHVERWGARLAKCVLHEDKDQARKQIDLWGLWYEFLTTIEPTTKLRLTLDDYKFFYREIGQVREEG